MENCNIEFDMSVIASIPYVRQGLSQTQERHWKQQGHQPRSGAMFDMRCEPRPLYTDLLVEWASKRGLTKVGVTYYRMEPGDNLPYHSDLYSRYIEVHDLYGKEESIRRIIVFPQDRQPGHILEVSGTLYDWKAGDFVEWRYDAPHMAANLGESPRYSIQITGVSK